MSVGHSRHRAVPSLGIIAAAVAMLWTVLAMQIPTANLQETSAEPPQETIALHAGDFFEIKALNDDPSAQMFWILSKNRTYMQSIRSSTFQFRTTDAGTYRLDAAVTATDGSELAVRTFLLDVADTSSTSPTDDLYAVIRTDPPMSGSTLPLPADRQVIRFDPVGMNIASRSLAFDTALADASPTSNGTAFEQGSSPLYVWFSSPRPERQVSLRALRANGMDASQTFTIQAPVGASNAPEQVQPTQAPPPIIPFSINVNPDGAVAFSAPTQTLTLPQDLPLFFRWTFGDGNESDEAYPTHRYVHSGTYDVRVQVIELRTGQKVYDNAQSIGIVVQAPAASASSAPSSQASSAQSQAAGSVQEPSTTSALSSLGSILRIGGLILLVLLVFAALGALIVWLVNLIKRGGGSLQRALEHAETKIVGSADEKNLAVAPPMQIEHQPEEESEPTSSVETSASQTNAEPPPAELVQMENAPDWLKKGFESTDSETPPAPSVEPAAETVQTPAPAQPAPEPPAATEESLPDWLREPATTSASPSQPPTDTPASAPAPMVFPAAADTTATPAPVTEPAAPPIEPATVAPPVQDDVPDWLKPPTPAPVTPEPTPTPPAPAPVMTPEPIAAAQTPAEPIVTPPSTPEPVAAIPTPAPAAAAPAQPTPSTPTPADISIPAPTPVEPASAPSAPAALPPPEAVSPAAVTPPSEPTPPATNPTSPTAPIPLVTNAGPVTTSGAPKLQLTEQERERRRLKRKRYRDNLKKRHQTETAVKQTSATNPTAETPAPVAAPGPKIEPATSASAETTAPSTPSVAAPPAPEPKKEEPPAMPVQPEPTPVVMTPPPMTEPTQTTPAATPSPAAQPPQTTNDDQVVFTVKAEDVTGTDGGKK